MPVTLLNRMRGVADRAFDADVLSWRDAVVANGGSVSLARLIVVDQFVFSEKASGNWALTDDYLGFWAENVAQALTSLKQRRLATAVNTPVFVADRHFLFDATTNYVDTGFVPNAHASAMASASAHIEIYERSNINGSNTSIGTNTGSNRQLRILARNGTVTQVFVNGNGGTFTLPAATSAGLTQAGCNSATATDTYGCKNGVAMARASDATATGASLPAHGFYVGGLNNQGIYSNGRAAQVGYVAWSGKLTEAQCLARYNAVQSWATAVGAQV